jgi:hypothetical protein
MYIILKSTIAAGQRRNAGEMIELSDAEASALLALGRVAVAEKPKASPAISDRSVSLETSDAQVVTTRGQKSRKGKRVVG